MHLNSQRLYPHGLGLDMPQIFWLANPESRAQRTTHDSWSSGYLPLPAPQGVQAVVGLAGLRTTVGLYTPGRIELHFRTKPRGHHLGSALAPCASLFFPQHSYFVDGNFEPAKRVEVKEVAIPYFDIQRQLLELFFYIRPPALRVVPDRV